MNSPGVPADPTPTIASGGTLVRPGALAWGQLDSAPPAAHATLVEDAVAAAATDPDRLTDLLDELRKAQLWLPLPDDGPVTDGSAVLLPTVTYLGAEFVPAFTSAERLAAWPLDTLVAPQGKRMRHIVVPAAELARLLPQGVGVALNPGAKTSVPVYPEGIEYLAGPDISGGQDAGQVRVGHPPTDPLALLGEVRASLCSIRAVRHASRAWLSVPGSGEGLVISVALQDPASVAARDAVIDAVEQAAARVPLQFPIDVTFPGEGAPDRVDEWIAANVEPFYVSGQPD